jgi:hypothetical protein
MWPLYAFYDHYHDCTECLFVDKMNLLKQKIEQQRQRKSNSDSKENSFDKSDLELQANVCSIDETSHGMDLHKLCDGSSTDIGKQSFPEMTCQFNHHYGCHTAHQCLTIDVENPVINGCATSTNTSSVAKLEAAMTHVHHSSSDPVILSSETFTSLMNNDHVMEVLLYFLHY